MYILDKYMDESRMHSGQDRENKQPWTNQDTDKKSGQRMAHETGPNRATPPSGDWGNRDKTNTTNTEAKQYIGKIPTLDENTEESDTDDKQCRPSGMNHNADEESNQHTMHEIRPDMATPPLANQALRDKLDSSESDGIIVSESDHPQGY